MHSVLIVGGGARSHALGEALRASPTVGRVVFAPGTSGLEQLGFETAPVASQDYAGLVELALMEEFDLTVIGPNTPLVGGIVDLFEAEDLPVFGPCGAAAKLEGSKSFARHLMNQLRIPTPKYAVCDTFERAVHLARSARWARVFKVDGLAYTRGVRVVDRFHDVEGALEEILIDNVYGQASGRIVVEERLEGLEVTVFALSDGEHVEVLGYVRNHPRLRDGGQGPPTRSMGQVSPAPEVTAALREAVRADILEPTVCAMKRRGTPLRGAFFVDLMLVEGRPIVIDYNVRFGDPATQTLLSAYSGDFYAVLQACRGQGQLAEAVASLTCDPRPRVSLVMVCEGYPERFVRGAEISIELGRFESAPDLWLFEDGVRCVRFDPIAPPRLETTGGRTYTIVAAAETEDAARARAYEAADWVKFEGMHYRGDI